MTIIAREITINKSKDEVWKAIAKFGDICHGSPGVLKSFVTSEQQEGVGATRHCDLFMMGATIEERISEWNEGESLTVDIYEFNNLPGIKSMKALFSVRTENGNTILRADLHYTMKNSFFKLVNKLMMKSMNTKNWNGVLAGHKKYIETGNRVDDKTVLNFSEVVNMN